MDLTQLRMLNFRQLIEVGCADPGTYTFAEYRKTGFKHKVRGCCVACERQNIHVATGSPDYKLCLVTHSAHSSDILLSLSKPPDLRQWHQEPVMFVYDRPSKRRDFYHPGIACEGHVKRPSEEWCWIHTDHEPFSFPQKFRPRTYDGLAPSLILTFRLANAYVTHLVKCNLNNPNGEYADIWRYDPRCIQMCFERFLSQEITLLQPRIIFTVGAHVRRNMERLLAGCPIRPLIKELPHPNGGRRGFTYEYFRVLYFWLVLAGLYEAGIVGPAEGKEMLTIFLNGYEVRIK